ncbi:MAG TPA: hypothetical protein VHR46_03510 [Gaiella sp.]|nr:hypothetical protein [Gaiella sp.]
MRRSALSLLAALTGSSTEMPALEPAGLGMPGLTGVERSRGPWDILTTAHAPELPGPELTFVALADGTLVVDADVPDGSVTPLADALEQELEPPYEAAAVRAESGTWTVAAHTVLIAPAAPADGENAELARVDGVLSAKLDDSEIDPHKAPPGLVALLDGVDGDAALTAERLDETTWVAQRWAL